jgi:hypothetical protein
MYLEVAEKVSNLFQIYFPLFFLALPQKEPKRSGPLKPGSPRKPKFPAIAQGHERRPFWFLAIRPPGKRTGHRAF